MRAAIVYYPQKYFAERLFCPVFICSHICTGLSVACVRLHNYLKYSGNELCMWLQVIWFISLIALATHRKHAMESVWRFLMIAGLRNVMPKESVSSKLTSWVVFSWFNPPVVAVVLAGGPAAQEEEVLMMSVTAALRAWTGARESIMTSTQMDQWLHST